jgi:AcrR family transcriptional regulator
MEALLMSRSGGATRRRGAALEDALLTAAWDVLSKAGYGGFTMEAVAERARTSTPVLYRRWPDRWDLAMAAIRHYGDRNPVAAPDTGSLRGDLIAFLRDASSKRAAVAAVFSLRMAEFFDETRATPAQARQQMLEGRTPITEEIFGRAVARGEADPDRLTPRVKSVAFDLLRNELVLTQRPVPRKVIEEIVDDIVLPLVRPRQ